MEKIVIADGTLQSHPCVIASEAKQSVDPVIASEAWQSHCIRTKGSNLVKINSLFPYGIAALRSHDIRKGLPRRFAPRMYESVVYVNDS